MNYSEAELPGIEIKTKMFELFSTKVVKSRQYPEKFDQKKEFKEPP